jgi:hypothetical protein
MKIKVTLILLSFTAMAFSVNNMGSLDNSHFNAGEKLTFWVGFSSLLTGKIEAGEAQIEIVTKMNTAKNQKVYQVVGKGGTNGFVEMFYVINYNYESFIDYENFQPLKLTVNKHENDKKKEDVVYFNQNDHYAKSKGKKTQIPSNVQDMLSAFYYIRMQDFSNLKKGDCLQVPVFLDDTVINSKIIFDGRERVETKRGKFKCLAFKPMMMKGNIFKQAFPATVWLTDDMNRLPVLFELKLTVGKMRVELKD